MPDALSSAVTLVKFGVIPASPNQPKLGFSIGTLAFYSLLAWDYFTGPENGWEIY